VAQALEMYSVIAISIKWYLADFRQQADLVQTDAQFGLAKDVPL
jgi:hypothetical protein